MNPSAPPAPDTALDRDPEAIEQLIAGVLGGAHRTMEALDTPNEARAILHVAHSFADELATLDPRLEGLAVNSAWGGET